MSRSTGERGTPGSTLTPTRLQLTPKLSAIQAGDSENQAAFSDHLPPLTPADMQDAASYVLLKGKTASPLQNNSEKVKYFCRYQIKGALPLHRANISLGCHATGAQVLKSLTSFYWKPKSLPTSTKIREFTRRGMVYSIFVMQRITLPCRRPIAAVPDNLTGCLGVPWGLMWLQELWGQQGHAVRWQIHILPKMQEVDIMDSKVLIFLRYLGYDTESQRVRNGCYLIFSTDSLKWTEKNLSYICALLAWCYFPY